MLKIEIKLPFFDEGAHFSHKITKNSGRYDPPVNVMWLLQGSFRLTTKNASNIKKKIMRPGQLAVWTIEKKTNAQLDVPFPLGHF